MITVRLFTIILLSAFTIYFIRMQYDKMKYTVIANDSKQFIKNQTEDTIKLNQKFKSIDTNLIFSNLKELLIYRNNYLLFLGRYCDSIKQISDSSYLMMDSIYLYNQELSYVLMYKNLFRLPKGNNEFHFLIDIFKVSKYISTENKYILYSQYPESLRSSQYGKLLYDYLQSRNDIVNNVQITSNNLPALKDVNNQIVHFNNLFNHMHKSYLFIVGATWCSPCKVNEMRIEKLIKNRSIDTVLTEIFQIYIDRNFNKWIENIKHDTKIGQQFICADGFDSKLFNSLKIHSIPFYFIVDSSLNIMKNSSRYDEALTYVKY